MTKLIIKLYCGTTILYSKLNITTQAQIITLIKAQIKSYRIRKCVLQSTQSLPPPSYFFFFIYLSANKFFFYIFISPYLIGGHLIPLISVYKRVCEIQRRLLWVDLTVAV